MSEEEKLLRDRYKKRREKRIKLQCAFIVVCVLAAAVFATLYARASGERYAKFGEAGNASYNVLLKDNDFYEGEELEAGQAYVAELIDKIRARFTYRIDVDEGALAYNYSYILQTKLIVRDKATGYVIYDPVLSEERNEATEKSGASLLDKVLVLDYAACNERAKEFIETYELNNAECILSATLAIKVTFPNAGENAGSDYELALNAPLAVTTTDVRINSTIPGENDRVLIATGIYAAYVKAFLITAIVSGALAAVLTALLVGYVYLTRNRDINYSIKVKKILSSYRSYIQRLLNPFDVGGYQLLKIETIDEMLAIRDTINSPILMYENRDKTSTGFFIPTNTKLLYMYEVRVEGFEAIYGTEDSEGGRIITYSESDRNGQRILIRNEAETEAEKQVNEAEVAKNASEAETTEAMSKAEKTENASEAEMAENASEVVAAGSDDEVIYVRYRTTFTSRLIQAGDPIQEYYTRIKNRFLSFKRIRAKASRECETFKFNTTPVAKLNVKGRAITLHLALDPTKYNEGKYHFTDEGADARYEKTPMLIKIKSERGARHALELVEELMRTLGAERGEEAKADYHAPYESNRELAKRGLVKVIVPSGAKLDGGNVREADVTRVIAEENGEECTV